MTKAVEVLGILISTCNGNGDLLSASVDVVEILLAMDIDSIFKRKCEEENIVANLMHFQTQNLELREKIDKFL